MSGDVLVGTASWTDPTLLATDFYPRAARTPEARLRYYSEIFPTVEVDSSFYAIPSRRNAELWVERTPHDFRFNVKAFAWITGHEAEVRALPLAIRTTLPVNDRREPRLRAPLGEALDLAYDFFRSAIEPLRVAGKLGCVLAQFPPWFTATPMNEAFVENIRQRLSGVDIAVEFRHSSWFDGRSARTLDFLRAHNLAHSCIDAPIAGSIPVTPFDLTTSIGYVRLHGRNRDAWFRRVPTAAQRFDYRYGDDELREVAHKVARLKRARTTYVLFNNCHADDGVKNAQAMQKILSRPSDA